MSWVYLKPYIVTESGRHETLVPQPPVDALRPSPSMRCCRALIGVPVPHLLVFSQQHVAADAGGLVAGCLRGVWVGIGDDHLAEQVAASDVGKREGDSYRGYRSRRGAPGSAGRD